MDPRYLGFHRQSQRASDSENGYHSMSRNKKVAPKNRLQAAIVIRKLIGLSVLAPSDSRLSDLLS
jgi:hypothetical protein